MAIYFSVCDKPNICTVSKVGKIVNINQIVEANSIYTCLDLFIKYTSVVNLSLVSD